jgi:hypothetical protein
MGGRKSQRPIPKRQKTEKSGVSSRLIGHLSVPWSLESNYQVVKNHKGQYIVCEAHKFQKPKRQTPRIREKDLGLAAFFGVWSLGFGV